MPTVLITGWGRGTGHIAYTHWRNMMQANVAAPVHVTPAFIGHLEASGQKKVIRAAGVADGRFLDLKGGAHAR